MNSAKQSVRGFFGVDVIGAEITLWKNSIFGTSSAKTKEFCARIIFLLQKACGYRRNYVNEKIGAYRFKKTGIFIVYHVLCLIYRERINMA